MGIIKDFFGAKKQMSSEEFDPLNKILDEKTTTIHALWQHLHEAAEFCSLMTTTDTKTPVETWKKRRNISLKLGLSITKHPFDQLYHKATTTSNQCLIYYKNFNEAYKSLPSMIKEFKDGLQESLPPFEACFKDILVDGAYMFEYHEGSEPLVFVFECNTIIKQCKKLLEEEITLDFPQNWN